MGKIVENIDNHILLVCKSLGAKVKMREKKLATPVPDGELRPLKEVLAQLGGAGTVIE